MPAVRLIIRGRVQGVGYRAWTIEQARHLGLGGFVRNRSDGSVEALFAGSDDAVESMIEKCRSGPPGAFVQDVEISPASEDDAPHPFQARPTY